MNTIQIQEAKNLVDDFQRTLKDGSHIKINSIDGTTFEPPILAEHIFADTVNSTACVGISAWFTDQLIDLVMTEDVEVQWRVIDE